MSKGSARRPGKDYEKGWDRIFAGKDSQQDKLDKIPDPPPKEPSS